MRITEQTSVREIRGKAVRLYQIRLAVAGSLILTFYLISRIGNFNTDLAPLIVLGIVELILNCPYPVYFKNSDRAFKYLAASVMTDFAVETLAIHFVGGIDAMFLSAIYLMSILYCALNLPAVFNFLMATLASLFYSGLIAAEYFDVIPHRPTFGLQLTGSQQIAVVISHIAFFYLIAIFARYLVDALIDKEQRMSALFQQLRAANQKIRYAHRLKSEFIAHVSHELKSPLNSMIGLSQLLKEPDIGPLNPKQSGFVRDIGRHGQRLLELINDVLDISKLEAGKTKINWGEVELVKLVQSTVDVFYEEALQRQVRLDFDPDQYQAIVIQADLRKMRQILYNLLSNAVKFTPKDGKVSIDLEKMENKVRLIVTDTGVGIKGDDQIKIFNPYEQGEQPEWEAMNTSLGLAITKRFVELHRGTITVKSRPGEGSQFIVTLPVAAPEKTDKPAFKPGKAA